MKRLESNSLNPGSKEWKYARMLEARRGSNYQYWAEELEERLLNKGYKWYARIIAGRQKNIQRIKMFSAIYKSK